jgi:hypothetical protein
MSSPTYQRVAVVFGEFRCSPLCPSTQSFATLLLQPHNPPDDMKTSMVGSSTSMHKTLRIVFGTPHLISDRINPPRTAVLGKHTRYAQTNSLMTALLVTLCEANDTSAFTPTCEDLARFSLVFSSFCPRQHVTPGKCPNRSRRQWQANTAMTPKSVLSTLVLFHKYIASLYCRCPTLAPTDL